jgi:hypothetical protein
MTRSRRALVLGLALALPAALVAQAPSRVASWKVGFDRSGIPDTAVNMALMAPGWHVTALSAAPGAIAFDGSLVAPRTFKLESEIFLFADGAGAGAGLVMAGRGLDTQAPRFVAFTVFPDGRFNIVRMAGAQREVLVLATKDAAINKHPGGKVNVKNVLEVEVDEKWATFKVNGTKVAQLPKSVVDAGGGVVGLRLEPGVNAHVSTFVLDGRNVAPVATK